MVESKSQPELEVRLIELLRALSRHSAGDKTIYGTFTCGPSNCTRSSPNQAKRDRRSSSPVSHLTRPHMQRAQHHGMGMAHTTLYLLSNFSSAKSLIFENECRKSPFVRFRS